MNSQINPYGSMDMYGMEWCKIGEEYVEDKRLAPFMIYVALSIFHISTHWILSVCLLLANIIARSVRCAPVMLGN